MMGMTNEERASAWLHANWPSHQVWSGKVAASLTALLVDVRADERLDLAIEIAKVTKPEPYPGVHPAVLAGAESPLPSKT
jgi:hypothetical protein